RASKEDSAGRQGDLSEKRLHAVIVGLAPAVEGVMVALGTGDTQTQEDLGQSAGPVAGLGHNLVEVGRPVFGQRALSGNNLAGELVQRFVLGDAVAYPAIKIVSALVAQDLAIHAQKVGPLQRPVVG